MADTPTARRSTWTLSPHQTALTSLNEISPAAEQENTTHHEQSPAGYMPDGQPEHVQSLKQLAIATLNFGNNEPMKILATHDAQVEAKEEAVLQGLQGLERLHSKIMKSKAETVDLDLMNWNTARESMKDRHKNFEFLVGVVGRTGAGKSSLLNALISPEEDIAPTSQSGACTAAVCFFRYHDPMPGEPKFMAEIKFKSKDTVDQELETLFGERSDVIDDDAADGPIDEEVKGQRERIDEKIRIVEHWSRLSRPELLKLAMTKKVSEITTRCKNSNVYFNHSDTSKQVIIELGRDDAEEFQLAVRPYIGNTKKSSKLWMWPLVETVHIYTKADILRNGIVLVDLPGEMDALESRSKIARTYTDKVHLTMVVAPCDRVSDDQTAAEYMRDDQVIELEASGKITRGGLGLIATKIDDMDWEDLIQEGWDPEDISPDMTQLLKDRKATKTELNSLKSRIAAEQGLALHRDEEKRLEEVLKALDEQCFRRCLDARNRDISEMHIENINQRRQSLFGNHTTISPLDIQVFPVSSRNHRKLKRNEAQPAFRDDEATGFRALTKWIRESSLPLREKQADYMLAQCQARYDDIETWAVKEWLTDLRLQPEDLPRIKLEVEGHVGVLKIKLKSLAKTLKRSINISSKFKRNILKEPTTESTESFITHINDYGQYESGARLTWGSYRACIRRSGNEFRTSGKNPKTICWQARTYVRYWKPHMAYWNGDRERRLDLYMKGFDANVQKSLSEFVHSIMCSADLPHEFKKACSYSIHNLTTIAELAFTGIQEIVNDLRTEYQDIRQGSREWIHQPFIEAYEEARTHTGKGMKKNQIKTMAAHAERIHGHHCKTTGDKIHTELQKAQKRAGRKIDTEIVSCHYNAGQEIYHVAEMMCAVDRNIAETGITTTAIQRLKHSVRQDVEVWNQQWWSLKARLPIDNLDILGDMPEEPQGEDSENDESDIKEEPKIKKESGKRPIKPEEPDDGNPPFKIARRS